MAIYIKQKSTDSTAIVLVLSKCVNYHAQSAHILLLKEIKGRTTYKLKNYVKQLMVEMGDNIKN